MTWVRIDDCAPLHPKLLRAGPEAAWLWIAGLAYANRHVTDGAIPAEALAALYPVDGWTRAKLLRLAAHLVSVGLWVAREGGGWLIHGYDEFQSEAMRGAVDERRAWERDRKARQREAARTRSGPSDSVELRPMSHRDRGGTVPRDMSHFDVRDTGGTPAGDTRASKADVSQGVSQAPDPSRPVPTDPKNSERAGAAVPAPRPKQAPEAETPPVEPRARAVFDAIMADPLLKPPCTRRVADLAVRLTAPDAFPGVNVLGQVLRAAAWNAGQRRPKRDGRAFLLGWLGRSEAEAPSPLASGIYAPAQRPQPEPAPRVIGVPVDNPASPEDVKRAFAGLRGFGGSSASR